MIQEIKLSDELLQNTKQQIPRKIEIQTTLTQKPKTISFSVWRPPTQTV